MKNKFLLFALTLFLCLSLFACSPKSNDSHEADDGQSTVLGDYIYTENTTVYIVYNGDAMSHTGVKRIYDDLCDVVMTPPVIVTDETPKADHEIVIGETNRPVSKEAYRRLGLMEKESINHHGYVIYSDGTSVAIAYDEDRYDLKIAELEAMNYFAENYLNYATLRIKKGIVADDMFDIIAWQQEKDDLMVAAKWEEARAALAVSVGDELAEDIITAMQSCYTLFTDDVISWFANLYDPIAGGYYYSNSGRDTVGYGPDLESTYQALAFMGGTGMADDLNTSAGEDVIPEWMQEQILKFAMELQDPVSGYFYHPQWGGQNFDDRRSLIDTGYVSRRGRDLKWALSLISRFGGEPTYDIPAIGLKGSGYLYDGTKVNTGSPSEATLTSALRSTVAAFVSGVTSANASIPTHLQSVENMQAYLNKLDVNGDSYYVGNLLESQANQILERDKQLDPSGKTTPLATAVKKFFDEHQNEENGAWTLGNAIDYESVNGILKISGVYNGIKKEFPNPVKAIRTAMLGITMEEPPTTVCYVLNPWYAITMLIQNVENYNSSPDKAAVKKDIEEIRGEILKNAVELINVTRDKAAEFKKEDGSFSYFPKTSGPNSQGVPVAVPETEEGDVNATYMFISGIPNHIFGILGCEIVPIYTKSDRLRYWSILEELSDIIKDEVVEFEPEDYEEEYVGELPIGVTIETGSASSAGIVTTLDKNGRSTNALSLYTAVGSNDIMRLSLNNYMPFFNAVVFEADIKIESAGGGGQFEMLPYGSPGDAYRIIIDYSKGGNVSIRNVIDFASVVIGKEGEWINLKLQYSFADIDYDRNGTKDLYVKIFANNKLVAEGYTPQGAEPVKESSISGIRFLSWTATNATLFLDNTLFYQDEVELKPAPIINTEDDSELITFEGSTSDNIPGKLATSDVSESGKVTITDVGTADSPDKVFKLESAAGAADTLKFYITKNLPGFNAVALETDIMLEAVSDSGEIELYITTAYNSTASRLIFSYAKGGDITVKRVNAQGVAEFTETVAKCGEWFKLRIEYTATSDKAVIKVYVGGELVAEGDAVYNSFHAAENVNMAKLTVTEAAGASVYLDDLMFEQLIITSEGTDTSEDGITFEENTLESIFDTVETVTTDKATVEIVENVRNGRITKSLKLVSPKDSLDLLKLKLSAPTEEAKDSVNTVVFEGNFKITDADAGNILTLYHKTADGDIANKIVFGWSASSGNIFVLNLYDGDSKKDFDTVVVWEGMNSYFKLKVEYTKISDTQIRIGFYVNGVKATDIDTVHPYEGTAIDADEITDIVLETYYSRKTTLFVDNLTVERTNVEVEAETPTPDPPVNPNPDTPVTPDPEIPAVPKDEYDGSIFDQEIDDSVSAGNWT